MIKKESVLDLIGLVFLVLGVGALVNSVFYLGDLGGVLWFCYIGLILLGAGVLKRNSFLLTSQMNILTLPLLFWSIDFVYFLFYRNSLFGVVDYFFLSGNLFGKIISVQHLITIPLGVLALFWLGARRNAWKFSFVQIAALFFASLLLTSGETNVNCVFRSCFDGFSGIIPYWLFWFGGMFFMILFTDALLSYFFRR